MCTQAKFGCSRTRTQKPCRSRSSRVSLTFSVARATHCGKKENRADIRRSATGSKSYTKSLLDAGVPKISEKIREESGELCEALAGESDERVVSEAADVLYHVMVGLLARGRTLNDVALELARRQGTSGHAEKAARPPK